MQNAKTLYLWVCLYVVKQYFYKILFVKKQFVKCYDNKLLFRVLSISKGKLLYLTKWLEY